MSCRECAPYGLNSCPMCEPDPVECPDCEGYGYVNCFAYDMLNNDIIEVTPATYIALPQTKEDAILRDFNFHKWAGDICPKCDGTGSI